MHSRIPDGQKKLDNKERRISLRPYSTVWALSCRGLVVSRKVLSLPYPDAGFLCATSFPSFCCQPLPSPFLPPPRAYCTRQAAVDAAEDTKRGRGYYRYAQVGIMTADVAMTQYSTKSLSRHWQSKTENEIESDGELTIVQDLDKVDALAWFKVGAGSMVTRPFKTTVKASGTCYFYTHCCLQRQCHWPALSQVFYF